MSNDKQNDILGDYPEVKKINWHGYPDYIKFDRSRGDDWYIYQFQFIYEYLNRILKGWSVIDFFENIEPHQVALYSFTIFTENIVQDLRRNTNQKIYVSDKNFIKYEKNDVYANNMIIISPVRLYEKYCKGIIRKIIVCGMFYENEIMRELLNMGFVLEDLVTLSSILV